MLRAFVLWGYHQNVTELSWSSNDGTWLGTVQAFLTVPNVTIQATTGILPVLSSSSSQTFMSLKTQKNQGEV